MIIHKVSNIACDYWNPTKVERIVLITTMETLGLFSVCGTAFVLVTYLLFRARLRHFLPFWLALSSFFLAIFVLFSPLSDFRKLLDNHTTCLVQAIGIQFFSNATNFWSLVIFLHMHAVITGASSSSVALLSSWWAHLFVWGLAAALTLVPALLGLFGPTGPWCWLKCASYDVWGVAFFFAEMLVVVLLQVVLWIRMYRSLRQMRDSQSLTVKDASSSLIRRCTSFVWLNFSLFLCMASYRVFEIVAPGLVVYILELLDALALSSMGFLLSFCVFGLTKENYRLWAYFTPSCCAPQHVQLYAPPGTTSTASSPLLESLNDPTTTDSDDLTAPSPRYQVTPWLPTSKSKRLLHQERAYNNASPSLSETSESDTAYHPEMYGSYGSMAGVNFKEVEFASN